MKIRSRFLTQAAGLLAGTAFDLLTRTWRIEYATDEPAADAYSAQTGGFLVPLWHDAIMIPLGFYRRYRTKRAQALVSRHQDGSYLTEFLTRLNITAVRGSTNHGGDVALRQLMRDSDNTWTFITPDGPRGPRRQLKDGIVFLASTTGLPILPLVSSAKRVWTVRGNWTDLTIPKPFSHTRILTGTAIHVPPDLSRPDLAMYRDRVQASMESLQTRCEAWTATGQLPPLAAATAPAAKMPLRDAA